MIGRVMPFRGLGAIAGAVLLPASLLAAQPERPVDAPSSCDGLRGNFTPGDEHVARVLAELNQAAKDLATWQHSAATSAEVRALAAANLQDRMSLEQQQGLALAGLGARDAESPLSNELRCRSAEQMADLAALPAPQAGEEALDIAVDSHAEALAVIENDLLPNVHDDALRLVLEDARNYERTQLEQALALKSALPASSSYDVEKHRRCHGRHGHHRRCHRHRHRRDHDDGDRHHRDHDDDDDDHRRGHGDRHGDDDDDDDGHHRRGRHHRD